MSTAREGRAEVRRALLGRIVALQLEVQTAGDPEARALLEEARTALQAFDAESLRLFNREVSRRGKHIDDRSGTAAAIAQSGGKVRPHAGQHMRPKGSSEAEEDN